MCSAVELVTALASASKRLSPSFVRTLTFDSQAMVLLIVVVVGVTLAAGRTAAGLATGVAGFTSDAGFCTTAANLLLGSGWAAFACASRSM